MKKRMLSLTMVAAMVLSLAACGGKSTTQDTTGAQTGTTAGSDASGETTAAADETQASGSASSANPNAGKGMYPGTSKKGSISAEVTTISVMNPILMTYNNEFSVARHGWDCLVKLDENNNIVPAAAESWETSDDGLKWTFHIRQGAKWVDSQALRLAM